MCSNYRPVTRSDRLLTFFGVERERDELPPEIWPLGLAPFIRLGEEGSGNRVCDDGVFGLLPQWAEMAHGKKTYNARTETVARLPSFRDAWRKGQRCIVPAEAIFEPCWETGSAVRWCIQRPGAVPMGIAGIWERWRAPDGNWQYTFAMLTVNADGHPVFSRMHRPDDEKRMVVILDETDYGEWLSCRVSDAPKFFKQWMGPLDASPEPLPPRVPKPKPPMPPRAQPKRGPDDSTQGGLFE
jgi:putative SOS response-associated peptidase YedK